MVGSLSDPFRTMWKTSPEIFQKNIRSMPWSKSETPSGLGEEDVVSSIVESLVFSSLKRVENKRKRVKRKLNMKFFKSWATNMFCESGFKKGIRKLETLHDCMGSCWGRRRPGRRLSWKDTVEVKVIPRVVRREEDEENREDEEEEYSEDEVKIIFKNQLYIIIMFRNQEE
mgnify:CR=1 FL=1